MHWRSKIIEMQLIFLNCELSKKIMGFYIEIYNCQYDSGNGKRK